jgi:hypothetical protein
MMNPTRTGAFFQGNSESVGGVVRLNLEPLVSPCGHATDLFRCGKAISTFANRPGERPPKLNPRNTRGSARTLRPTAVGAWGGER